MSSPRQTIWITRTRPGAEITAERVLALGHQPFVAPLLVVQPTKARVDLDGVAALAFTSANGVHAFAASTPMRDIRVYAVGTATAAAARASGFRTVLHTSGDVSVLADALISRRRELQGQILHPSAAEPAGDLVGALEAAGVPARAVVVYETLPAILTPEELERLPGLDAVLIQSAKAARTLAAVLKTTPAPQLRALAVSKAALRPLSRTKLAARFAAESTLEANLLNLINRST
jgi:uroporphyrinogen-III synthase